MEESVSQKSLRPLHLFPRISVAWIQLNLVICHDLLYAFEWWALDFLDLTRQFFKGQTPMDPIVGFYSSTPRLKCIPV